MDIPDMLGWLFVTVYVGTCMVLTIKVIQWMGRTSEVLDYENAAQYRRWLAARDLERRAAKELMEEQTKE